MSHPSWVRGLKCQDPQENEEKQHVAPFVGAWIEITSLVTSPIGLPVAPFVGAWIEIVVLFPNTAFTLCRTLRGCVD